MTIILSSEKNNVIHLYRICFPFMTGSFRLPSLHLYQREKCKILHIAEEMHKADENRNIFNYESCHKPIYSSKAFTSRVARWLLSRKQFIQSGDGANPEAISLPCWLIFLFCHSADEKKMKASAILCSTTQRQSHLYASVVFSQEKILCDTSAAAKYSLRLLLPPFFFTISVFSAVSFTEEGASMERVDTINKGYCLVLQGCCAGSESNILHSKSLFINMRGRIERSFCDIKWNLCKEKQHL